jgi:hypothetical protein
LTERIFAEDREIVEMEQAAYDEQGGDWNQEVFPAIRDLRALLAANGQVINRAAQRREIRQHERNGRSGTRSPQLLEG